MASYFDEDEDLDAQDEQPRDTEVTLTWGAVFGMGLGLLLICGLCFALGYMAGHRSPAPAASVAPAQPQNAPDQEPLQGSSSVPKPSASEQAPVTPTEPAGEGAPSPAAEGGESSEAAAPSPTQSGSQGGSSAVASAPQPQVRPALEGSAPESAPLATAPGARPAMPPAASLTVQVAAVKNAEDAGVLIDALRRRGYPVSEQREAADGLVHVRVGPFASREEANRWRDKLLDDGYNAIVQP
jgi:DedD protein